MLLFRFLIFKVFRVSALRSEFLDQLNNVFQDNREIQDLYERHKETGYYIFETSKEKFWGIEYKGLRAKIVKNGFLSKNRGIQIYMNELSFKNGKDVDSNLFLANIKEIVDKQNLPIKCSNLRDLNDLKENKVFQIEKTICSHLYDGRLSDIYLEKNKNIGNRVLILSNSKIDAHLMMLAYKTVSRRSISKSNISNNDSLLVFLSILFNEEDEKIKFKNEISYMNLINETKKRENNLLMDHGLFGSFSKKDGNIRFDITTLYKSQNSLNKTKAQFECLSSVLEMFELEKKNQDLICKKIGFSIRRFNCNNSDLGKKFYESKSEIVVYEITNYISDRKDQKEIIIQLLFSKINYSSEGRFLHEIRISFLDKSSQNNTINTQYSKNDILFRSPEINICIRDDINNFLEKSELEFRKKLFEKNALKNLKDLISISIRDGINPYITGLPISTYFFLENKLFFSNHKPLLLFHTFKESLKINDMVEIIAKNLFSSRIKCLKNYTKKFLRYELYGGYYMPDQHREKIWDIKYSNYNFKNDLIYLSETFEEVDFKKINRNMCELDDDDDFFLIYFEHPEDITKNIFLHLYIKHSYSELFKRIFNKKIKNFINKLSFDDISKAKLDLSSLVPNNSQTKLEALKSKLCEFFDTYEMYNNVTIRRCVFNVNIGEGLTIEELFFQHISSFVGSFLQINIQARNEWILWLKEKLMEKIYEETENEILCQGEYDDIEIMIAMYTGEPYIPDVLYTIYDSIIAGKD